MIELYYSIGDTLEISGKLMALSFQEEIPMIVSFIDGRLRIRDVSLKYPSTAENLRKVLLDIKGVSEVETNRRVGSLLVIYDKAVTGITKIVEAASAYLNIKERTKDIVQRKRTPAVAKKLIVRRASNIGMILSLATSVIAAIVGVKGLHIAAGTAFLLFFVAHFAQHKEKVFL